MPFDSFAVSVLAHVHEADLPAKVVLNLLGFVQSTRARLSAVGFAAPRAVGHEVHQFGIVQGHLFDIVGRVRRLASALSARWNGLRRCGTIVVDMDEPSDGSRATFVSAR